MRTVTRLSLAAVLLCPVAAMATVAPTPTPMEACTPRPDPLSFAVLIEPAAPQVGGEVRVTIGLSEIDGLLIGDALISLGGAAPLFGRDPEPIRQEGVFQGPVRFTLQAQVGGAVELFVTVDYETECACPPACFYRRTVTSPPVVVNVRGPTATPTATAPAPCAGDCDGNGAVTIDELLAIVNVVIGREDLARCDAADVDRDGAVDIADLISAVNRALAGCPA